MSDDLRLTRRGLLQMAAAVITTASFAARRPLFPAAADASVPRDAVLIDDQSFITDHVHSTRFEQFLRSRGIKPAHLARESGYSRRFLLGLRLGRIQPARCCIARVTQACRRLTREPVRTPDLFDLPGAVLRAVERAPQQFID